MIDERELIETIGAFEVDAVQRWIALGWVRPACESGELLFDQSDVARVRLIYELHYELHIEEDSLSVVLSLMDQLYAARRALGALSSAVEAQPEEVRTQIAEHLKVCRS
jgi:chaperone modulatory protein CbpM